MKQSIIAEKSYLFAIRIIKLHLFLCNKEKYLLSLCNQLLTAGTSIGANVEEALGGFSRKEFSAKMAIAYKEAREAKYWIRLMKDTDILELKIANSFLKDIEELTKILSSIVKAPGL
ncbi:MAG TPA: four helix bundle protein [Chitinophagaceae bacterium]|nr:four helix bundle protein [Chitinophagaceae bacterium]